MVSGSADQATGNAFLAVVTSSAVDSCHNHHASCLVVPSGTPEHVALLKQARTLFKAWTTHALTEPPLLAEDRLSGPGVIAGFLRGMTPTCQACANPPCPLALKRACHTLSAHPHLTNCMRDRVHRQELVIERP